MVLSHYVLGPQFGGNKKKTKEKGPQFGGNKKKTKEKKNDDVQL